MPTYDYQCEKCQGAFELFQSMKDAPLATCPQARCCMETWGQGKVRRLVGTGAGLIFKGSGFYITDYRSSGYKEALKKESSGTGEAKPQSGGGSESSSPKPASGTGGVSGGTGSSGGSQAKKE